MLLMKVLLTSGCRSAILVMYIKVLLDILSDPS